MASNFFSLGFHKSKSEVISALNSDELDAKIKEAQRKVRLSCYKMDEIVEYFDNIELNFHMTYDHEVAITNKFGFVEKTVDMNYSLKDESIENIEE